MTYLLDVNALLAALWASHQHHSRFRAWSQTRPGEFATCALTELGYLRVINAVYGVPVVDAKQHLLAFKASPGVGFWSDTVSPAITLPTWVSKHSQTTDGYLCALAQSHGAKLATFDTGIKSESVFLVP